MPIAIAHVVRRLNGAKLASQHLLCVIEHPILRLAFYHSWIRTQSYLNFSTCFNDIPLTFKNIGQDFFKRCSTPVLEVLIFIPAMSQAPEKPLNACWRPDSEKASKTKSSSKSNRLIGSSELDHPVLVSYEKERCKNTFLPKTNAYIKWLWLFTIHANTNFRLKVEWLNRHQEMHINAILLQQFHELFSRNLVISLLYCSIKYEKTSFANSQDFSKPWFGVKVWSVVLQPGQK